MADETSSLRASPLRWKPTRLPARVRSWAGDRVNVALGGVLLVAGAFYLWTAGTSFPLTLHGGELDRYNLLATALLHLRLSIGAAPAGLVHLAEPYAPAQNKPFLIGVTDAASINDDVLYRGHLYFLWGPAPALVLLVPLHLLGLEPSPSATVACFAIAGLGFALGTLRVLLRRIGEPSLWLCVLAGSTLALSSTVPFILRTPSPTEDTISGGYCFAMAGIWLASSVLTGRRASLGRLALISLCIGLAAGSRATLGVLALVLVPVYLAVRSSYPLAMRSSRSLGVRSDHSLAVRSSRSLGVRSSHSRRGLLMALAGPVGVCLLLLLAYNQARFGDPLEFGTRYQLAGYDPLTTRFSGLRYVLPGAWFYTFSPPRPTVLFPFLDLTPPPLSYPVGLPTGYLTPEITGGLLPMTPILVFLLALPWIWRRRPAWLGSLAPALLILAGAGVLAMLFVSYEFFSTTERYEVDFSTLLLLGALAAWLTLSVRARGPWRRLVRVGGALLAVWGCLVGLLISFAGYGNYLAVDHPGTWTTLENVGSPLSSAIAAVAGRPLLAEVLTPNVEETTPVSYTSLGTNASAFWLNVDDRADLTIVSPDARTAALSAEAAPGTLAAGSYTIKVGGGARGVVVEGPRRWRATYLVPPNGRRLRIPLRLQRGVNRFALLPLASRMTLPDQGSSTVTSLLLVSRLSLASRY